MKEIKETEEEISIGYEEEPYRDGFNLKTVFAALFIGFIILPGAIYLGLLTGQSLSGAAEWVTIILFLEITKRSLGKMSRQEIYVIYSIAGGLVAPGVVLGAATLVLHGGFFSQNIWNQFLRQSPQAEAFGLAKLIPNWVVPPIGSEALTRRSFLHPDWFIPVVILLIHQFLFMVNSMSLGYVFFRVTSDIEKLSFPMAYVAAGGATALAETTEKKETWRWEIFSIGGMIGLVFGAIYVTIPTITGLMMAQPLTILPIPFVDFTPGLSNFFPAAAFAITTDLGALLTGMVIPFWMVMGIFIGGVVSNFILNPVFYRAGIFTHWKPGMGILPTSLSTSLDLWLSVSIGMSIIVAVVGIQKIVSILKEKKFSVANIETPKGRGDISISLALVIWAVSTLLYIILCNILVPDFPLWIIIIFGFVLTPLLTYISARMLGLGNVSGVGFPYLKEASFILSGYKGAAIWFAPVPYYNHAGSTQGWKMADLVRVKFKSIIKASVLGFFVTAFCSFLFWGITWKLGSIPSTMYPFVQKIWPYEATFKCLWASATMEGGAKWMLQAVKLPFIIWGAASGALIYFLLNLFGAPILIFYGILGGIGILPVNAPLLFIGALMGRYIFARKYGKMWRSYTPILLAGYGCGMGLIAMASISIALIGKSISQLIF